ncbi:MAG: phosphoserine phosphatase SerB [Sphingomonadales bacterium]|nr:phosphoserine phosphatase SerB [Sphingomonadales bacterium]
MKIVVTIVSNPQSFPLTGDVVAGAVRAIEAEGGKLTSKTILSDNEAVDLFFSDIEQAVAKSALSKLFTAMPLDFFCSDYSPNSNRKKKMLVADMDSTILTVECIDEIADMLGIKQQVSQITEAAMRGELDFSASLIQRVALLKGLPAEKLDEVYKTHIHLSKGAKTLVKTMASNGASTHLLSGGFTYFSEKVAVEVGFTHNHANVLEIENGVLTGKVTEPILHADSKRELLVAAREQYKLGKDDVLAVGDGANDIPMILEAGLGVAYMAKPKTAEQATAAINHTSLETLLFYQGYKKAEFTN